MTNVMYNHGVRRSGTDTHYTPSWVTSQLSNILGDHPFLDPCPGNRVIPGSVLDKEQPNGLASDWSKFETSFVNPPYSEMSLWIAQAVKHTSSGKHHSLWFTKLDYRTAWFKDLAIGCKWIIPVTGYTKFEKEDGTNNNAATFQVCFALFTSSKGVEVDIKHKVIASYPDRLYLG